MLHFKKFTNPDATFFGAQDFSDFGSKITVTIARHEFVEVVSKNKPLEPEKKGALYFREPEIKPFIVNSTNGETIAGLYGYDVDGWVGKRITLYFDPRVRFGRKTTGGVRVEAPADESVKCVECQNEIKAASGMSPATVAEYTISKYGRALCAACAATEKKRAEEAARAKNILNQDKPAPAPAEERAVNENENNQKAMLRM